jgi:lipoprotein-anchoring transpeptidase ErfK/SrfK
MALASQSGSPVSRRNMYRRRRRRPGRFIALLVIVAILGGTWWMWSSPKDTMATSNEPPQNEQALTLEPTEVGSFRDAQAAAPTTPQVPSETQADPVTTEPAREPDPVAIATPGTLDPGTSGTIESTIPIPDGLKLPKTPSNASARLLGAIGMVDTDPLRARLELSNLVAGGELDATDRAAARSALNQLGRTIFYTPEMIPEDRFTRRYQIQSGDSLDRIARRKDVHAEWTMIQDINQISNPSRIQLGQGLKLPVGVFHAIVSKSDFVMDLYLSNEHGDIIVASYPVGLGALNGTPTGGFRVRSNSKLVNPQWKNPRTGEFFLPDDPSNPIGERWIGLEGTDTSNQGLLGYGIHGTVDPDSIGDNQSMGCIRLLAPDVERVYDALTTKGSTITINP